MVVRNERGEFVAAAVKNHCGIASPLLAEFVVPRDAALSVQELKLMAVEMEGDALLVMAALQRAGRTTCPRLGILLWTHAG